MAKKKPSLKVVLSVLASSFMILTLLTGTGIAQLAPADVDKYVTPLFVPPAMPDAGTVEGGTVDYYEIAKRQFLQQVLPAGFPMTTVWGFGAVNTPGSFHYPSYTIEADVNRQVRVKWINDLKAANGNFLPHLFAADVVQTFHWANPPQQCADGTTRPDCAGTSGEGYFGPVPLVVHLHGSHVEPVSDGFPEAWYLPAANNIPAGYATRGSDFNQHAGTPNEAGAAYFQYRNDQRATTLWFHDHSLGITRLNIYAGPTGFYLLRGGAYDLAAGVLPAGAFEIPMIFQTRAFHDNGALDFAGFGDVNDMTVVNGNTWPFLNVEPRQYRFRFLNADNDQDIDLTLSTSPDPADAVLDAIWWIGADGGFLPLPQNVANVPLHIAERADVIIDFSTYPQGTVLYLVNDQGDLGTTAELVQFRVGALTSADATTPVDQLVLPFFPRLGAADVTRRVSLNEGIGGAGKLLGIVAADNTGVPLFWADNVTESPQFGDTEIWEIHGIDGGHPIHIHMVQFEIIDRTPLGDIPGGPTSTPPGPGETGTKDTVVVGNEIVRVKALFDIGGKFVWHCHILEHEDNEMMRPYEVLGAPEEPPPPPPPPDGGGTITITGGGGGGGCAMVATKGDIKDVAGAYGALVLVALGLAFRRRLKRRER
jgi:bilirubin oxidase